MFQQLETRTSSVFIERGQLAQAKDFWGLVDHITSVCEVAPVDILILTSGPQDLRYFTQTEGGAPQTILQFPLPIAFFLSDEELECYLFQKLQQYIARAEMSGVFEIKEVSKRFQEIDGRVNQIFGAALNLQTIIKSFNLHQLWCLFTEDQQFYRSLVKCPTEAIFAFFSNAQPFLTDWQYKDLIIESMNQADERLLFVLSVKDRMRAAELNVDDVIAAALQSDHENRFFQLDDSAMKDLLGQFFARKWLSLSTDQLH